MANKCENCTENCPQAERAHQAALGRMYATNEFMALLKKVESGEMVEVVRCKDCKYRHQTVSGIKTCQFHITMGAADSNFCSYGERREGE